MTISEVRPSTFRLGHYDGHEQLVIPACFPRRGWLVLLGLLLWPLPFLLKDEMRNLVTGEHRSIEALQVMLVLWLAPAIIGLILQIAWWLGGSERIAIIRRDILLRHTIFGLPVATWSFRGDGIRFLAPSAMPRSAWLTEPAMPFLSTHAVGSLKFFYRERTVYLGEALDETEAQSAVDWLATRLPPAASARIT